ncbi:MAG: hypothetical protein JST54_13605 [Deltaproteobacteria bacterium]|nr:hypothetical protein [Deltaproteobacteria bacterium]
MSENVSAGIAVAMSWVINALVGFSFFAAGFNGGKTDSQGLWSCSWPT